MKLFCLTAIAGAVVGVASQANAAVLASWNFDSSTTATASSYSADSGSGTATGGTGGTFSTPAGNGSAKSFSSNSWDVGDYWQFSTSTTGYDTISLAFDQTGSNTGPENFKLSYSTDGSNFTVFSSYSLLAPIVSWSSTTAKTGSSYSFDLSGVSALNNTATVYFRLVQTDTVAVNGTTVAAGGTDRVDNVVISGSPTPEPASLSLLGFGGIALLRRRRGER